MQLFYDPTIRSEQTDHVFDKTESRHIVKVLRKSEGDRLYITDGNGKVYFAEIHRADEKKCRINILNFEDKEKPWSYRLHIAIAPPKLNDRMEWFLEKATEIGIDEITPLICQRSERKTFKLERYEKILQSAMKQSLQHHLPKLHAPTRFDTFIKQERSGDKYIAHCEKQAKRSLKEIVQIGSKQTILIGPEGDFSPAEIKSASEENFTAIHLGENRLRTETAALVACHSIAFLHQK